MRVTGLTRNPEYKRVPAAQSPRAEDSNEPAEKTHLLKATETNKEKEKPLTFIEKLKRLFNLDSRV